MTARPGMCVSVLVLASLLSVGCGTSEAPSADAGAEALVDGCSRYDSFAGQTLVGNPEPSPTEGLILGEPGLELGPQRESPVLDAISTTEVDRVRFDVVGDGFIGWSVRFVQDPRLRATDETAQISGKCVLQVDLSGVESGGDGIEKLAPETIAGIVEVLSFPSAEAITQTFVGTRVRDPDVRVDVTRLPDRTAILLSVR